MKFQVYSEIGPLKSVLTHRPGLEVDQMPPSIMEELLFDDILFGDQARKEHDTFTNVLKAFGATVYDTTTLLKETLEQDESICEQLLTTIQDVEGLSTTMWKYMNALAPEELAEALVAGITYNTEEMSSEHFFKLRPVPNLLMARDAQIVIGDGYVISSMKRKSRFREAILSQFIFSCHPEFKENTKIFDYSDNSSFPDTKFGTLSIEGGDVTIFKEGIVIVGVSERTMEKSIDLLAETLRAKGTFRKLIMVRMPANRSQMHLDTIFTRISDTELLTYPPMINDGFAETLSVCSIDLQSKTQDHGKRHPSVSAAFKDAGLEMTMIPCGGANDYIQQTREQWTDGANSFTLAPGFIILYDRNSATLRELEKHNFTRIKADDFISEPSAIIQRNQNGEKFVIELPSSELSRARGGPRCMTMPLVREKI